MLRLSRALALCLLASAPAFAAAPLIEDQTFTEVNDPVANCGDFVIIANGEGSTRTWVYFGRDGAPLKFVLHGHYRGTLTNSVTGATLLDAPSVAIIDVDLVTGQETRIGAFWTVTLPGVGRVLFNVGRMVFDGSGPPVFIAGQHVPPEEEIALLCAGLRL